MATPSIGPSTTGIFASTTYVGYVASPMELGLSGRVALVAGASQGIGRATALSLAGEGADLVLFARSADKLLRVAEEVRALGRRAHIEAVDVSDREALRGAYARSRETLGVPVILVLCVAALFEHKKLQFMDDAEVDRLIATDVRAAIDLCRIALGGMVEARFGRIVAVSSLAAHTGVSGGTLYAASKAALEGLVRGIALDDSRRGVTANAVAVGFTDTERLRARVANVEGGRERLERATARRTLATPAEVADAITFLASTRAAAITGAVIDVSAGGHLNNLW